MLIRAGILPCKICYSFSTEDEEEKIEGEMLIRTLPTTLLQILFNAILYSKVIAISIEVADVNF